MTTEELEVRANGLTFRVLAAGPAGGEPFLLLHGFPEGAESWAHHLEVLAAAGHRAYAPDLRGYGGSDAPEGVEAYAMPTLIADVTGLAAALGLDRVNLAGHDWGALIGWPVASRHPELVRTWTALSIGHPAGLARAAGFTGEPPDQDQRQRSSYVAIFRQEGDAEAILTSHDNGPLRNMYRLGPNPDAVPDPVIDRWVEGFVRPGRLTAALNYYRANLHRQAYLDFDPCPDPVTMPVTLLWGAEDPAVGRVQAEATAGLVAGAYRFVELAGAGHWLQFERPEEVSEALLAAATAGV